MKLRPYQERAVTAVRTARLQGRRRVLYCSPTGTGKTQIFCGIQRTLGGPALVLAHRGELLEQAAQRFQSLNPGLLVDIEQADQWADRRAEVVCASIQTLYRGNRLDWFRPRLVIVDEAHHAPAPSFRSVLERFGCWEEHGPFLVGCTATPKRLDGIALGHIFEEQVFTYSIREAIEDGWLSDVRGFRVRSQVDLSRVHRVGDDFNKSELAAAVDEIERTRAAVRHWQEVAADRPTIVFCVTVAHAEHAAEAWQDIGVTAEWIDGTMKPEERRAVIARFKNGETQVLVNVEILTEGFDHPPVSCVVMLRPTQSWALYVQCVGRGTRGGFNCPVPGKSDLVVIDVVDNTGRHSLATVPAMLGLPANLDLQGTSLLQAAEKLEQLAERLEKIDPSEVPCVETLDTLLEQIDLLANVGPPDEVRQAGCRLSWERRGENGYRVRCGTERRDRARLGMEREAMLWHTGVQWQLAYVMGGRVEGAAVCPGRLANNLVGALLWADQSVLARWPDAGCLADQNAPWRDRPVSDKQAKALQRFGVAPAIIQRLANCGEASDLLNQLHGQRRGGDL